MSARPPLPASSRESPGGALTGTEIRELRLRLGFSAAHFADLVGTSQASVWRWEAARDGVPAIDPFQARVLAALRGQVAKPEPAADDVVEAITAGLLVGGGLWALHALLSAVVEDDAPRRQQVGDGARRTARRAKGPTRSNTKKGE